MSLSKQAAVAFAAALSVGSFSYAAVIDTVTINGSHAGDPNSLTSPSNVADAVNNSRQTVNLTPGYTLRQITFNSGTVTKVISSTFTSDAAFLISGPALATAPNNRTGPLTSSGNATAVTPFTVLIPGGVSSSSPLTFEAIDTFFDGNGVDETSTSSVSFDDAYPANTFEYSGSTRGAPTFVRANGFNSPGTAGSRTVSYQTFRFTVGAAGVYSIASAQNYDGYLQIFADQFDPNFSTGNLLAFGDEAFNILRPASLGPVVTSTTISQGASGLNVSLLPGTTYSLVTSGYQNGDAGEFINLILGPGTITQVVPEPGSLALLGTVGLGLAVRRRRA